MSDNETAPASNFIHEMIDGEIKTGKSDGRIVTRFPPEPNGYLHIGHAKSICLNYGTAQKYNGTFHLRFDDTNPTKEDTEYVESIMEDVRWLGADWKDKLFFASDYFEKFYEYAVQLIKLGKAYVCELSDTEMREYRGTLTAPGKESPYRNRSVEENLDLFARMRAGEFEDGSKVLRAKIDMASPNIHMRDPVIYRIRHTSHHRSGDQWCIYPMYDFAHPLEDAIEHITHSICTLEFEIHRPFYDWLLESLVPAPRPQQIEFARLNLTNTVMSKRKLLELVKEHNVSGWDDPRMPTISGLRRRGVPPEAIRAFCEGIGVTKYNSLTDLSLLEYYIRENLNKTAKRVMVVMNPLKVILDNYPDDLVEEMDAVNNPENPEDGTRKVPFSKVLYIERDDFREEAPKKFYRLAPGAEVRLRYAYFVKCVSVDRDGNGEITAVHCTYDPETRGGNAPDGRKVKGTIHWVSAKHAFNTEVRLYDRLFTVENVGDIPEGEDYRSYLNPDSLKIVRGAMMEPSLKEAKKGDRFQFERIGYFCVDSKDEFEEKPVFNRTVQLKDSWAKIEAKKN
ncbi:MAG TPA: glutamine--tRNA ligase [Lentisphaeria bacterium]|nr:glutamine--tRNA ligase [Lentisphaeria bacterium]HCG50866.1 glutamine--tRNA ligase [Lentisphaeria bacterium]